MYSGWSPFFRVKFWKNEFVGSGVERSAGEKKREDQGGLWIGFEGRGMVGKVVVAKVMVVVVVGAMVMVAVAVGVAVGAAWWWWWWWGRWGWWW
jgi:hypothetical protein